MNSTCFSMDFVVELSLFEITSMAVRLVFLRMPAMSVEPPMQMSGLPLSSSSKIYLTCPGARAYFYPRESIFWSMDGLLRLLRDYGKLILCSEDIHDLYRRRREDRYTVDIFGQCHHVAVKISDRPRPRCRRSRGRGRFVPSLRGLGTACS